MVQAAEADGLIDEVVARRARHVVSENDRVLTTAAALEAGDLAAIADRFRQSHASLRDDFEVSSPALDTMVEIAIRTPGVIAARMTGAGFGGCTINLVRPDAVERLSEAVARDYRTRTGLTPRVFPVMPAEGAGFIEPG
jgi:galactokinase